MVATLNSGPFISAGNLMDSGAGNTPQITNPSAGPNMDYHGDSFLDVRYYPIAKEYIDRHGIIPAFQVTQQVLTVNAVPATKGVAKIAAAANPTTGTALTLAAASAGIATNIPFDVFGPAPIAVAPIVLDFGFENISVTAGSKTATVANSALYMAGLPLVIAQALTATAPLITYVTGTPTPTTITLNNAAGFTNASAPCGAGNSYAAIDNIPNSPSTFSQPYTFSGAGLFFDATQALARCVTVTGVAGGVGGTVTVNGWDIYGNPQTSTVTLAAGANTVTTLKAFKYIKSVVPNFTDTNAISVGTSDTFGFPLRSDLFEQTLLYNASTLITANTGFTGADKTTPATALTGDTRGTYTLQTASNGANRTVFYQFPSLWQLCRSNPTSYAPLYGVTPV